jgi:hypothetical protein
LAWFVDRFKLLKQKRIEGCMNLAHDPTLK